MATTFHAHVNFMTYVPVSHVCAHKIFTEYHKYAASSNHICSFILQLCQEHQVFVLGTSNLMQMYLCHFHKHIAHCGTDVYYTCSHISSTSLADWVHGTTWPINYIGIINVAGIADVIITVQHS